MSAERNGSQLDNAEVDAEAGTVALGLDRGPRPRFRPSQPNEFRTPALPAPRLTRSSSWPLAARSHADILAALDILNRVSPRRNATVGGAG